MQRREKSVSSEQAKALRQQGITAAKAGQKDQARQLLQQSLRLEPNNEAAWVWLTTIARDQRERMAYLARLLEINPNNELGQKALHQLGISRSQLMETVRGQSSGQVQSSGIPIPDADKLAEAQHQADTLAREYLAPLTYPGITWTRKEKGRVGEGDIIRLRLYIGAAIAGALLVLGIIGFVVVSTNPELRGVVFAPTSTASPTPVTPTATFTPTPGVTPTASPTPELTYTPSPTVPANIPNGASAPPRPTDIYPPPINRALRDAVGLLDKRAYDTVIPTLQVEVTLVQSNFDAAPYYYQALALAGKGDLEEARRVLQDAQRRLTPGSNPAFVAMVNGGLAYVDLRRAQAMLARGERGDALNALLLNAEQQAQTAITADARLELPYRVLAGRFLFDRSYDRALGILDRGLATAPLASNVNLIVEKGEVYFRQEEYHRADYQAFLGLYVDPAAESAHLLSIRTALALNDPGLAVLRTQAYLFYYPGSAQGYRLLGDARAAENNDDLALNAYDQALVAGDNPDILVARAGLYTKRRRFDLARDDLSKALNVQDDPAIRAKRMQAAYAAGSYSVAEEDAKTLAGQAILTDAELQLLQARIKVDEAQGADDYQAALGLMTDLERTLDRALLPTLNEYRARAQYRLGNYADALRQINAALLAGETGYRHYLRGLIFEAQEQNEFALRDYDWVLTWGAIYPYSFLPDARKRYEALKDSAGS
jgi:Tfp pilus assembly protein PilF